MPYVRSLYLETADRAADMIADPVTAAGWDRPSVLERMTIGDLAGHLARSVLQVEWYLDAVHGDGAPVDAAAYYLRDDDPANLDSAHNRAIRDRSTETARVGHARLVESIRSSLDRLRRRLPSEPDDRLIEALGRVLPLDEYLRTRLVEICVHFDDLGLSTGIAGVSLPPEALEVAVETLFVAAQRRHGVAAVLTAMTRRERDQVQALRVL